MSKRTLINTVLVALACLPIGIGVSGYFSAVSEEERAKQSTLGVDVVSQALRMYKLHTREYPASLNELVSKPAHLVAWQGPYVKADHLQDAWGRGYHYQAMDGRYTLASLGPDGEPATEDDIRADMP